MAVPIYNFGQSDRWDRRLDARHQDRPPLRQLLPPRGGVCLLQAFGPLHLNRHRFSYGSHFGHPHPLASARSQRMETVMGQWHIFFPVEVCTRPYGVTSCQRISNAWSRPHRHGARGDASVQRFWLQAPALTNGCARGLGGGGLL